MNIHNIKKAAVGICAAGMCCLFAVGCSSVSDRNGGNSGSGSNTTAPIAVSDSLSKLLEGVPLGIDSAGLDFTDVEQWLENNLWGKVVNEIKCYTQTGKTSEGEETDGADLKIRFDMLAEEMEVISQTMKGMSESYPEVYEIWNDIENKTGELYLYVTENGLDPSGENPVDVTEIHEDIKRFKEAVQKISEEQQESTEASVSTSVSTSVQTASVTAVPTTPVKHTVSTSKATKTSAKPVVTITASSAGKPASTSPATLYTPVSQKTMYAKSAVNVRSGAGNTYSKLGVLSEGQSVQVIGESGNWYAVKYNSETGFVSKNYIQSTKPAVVTIQSKETSPAKTDSPVVTTSKKTWVTTTTTTTAVDKDTPGSVCKEVLKYANAERKAVGASSLVEDKTLHKYAMIRAEEISDYFSHTRPDGTTILSKVFEMGIFYTAAENIAYGQGSPKEAIDAWMSSTMGHREALLSTNYTHCGIGYFKSDGIYYWAMIFAG